MLRKERQHLLDAAEENIKLAAQNLVVDPDVMMHHLLMAVDALLRLLKREQQDIGGDQ